MSFISDSVILLALSIGSFCRENLRFHSLSDNSIFPLLKVGGKSKLPLGSIFFS